MQFCLKEKQISVNSTIAHEIDIHFLKTYQDKEYYHGESNRMSYLESHEDY